MLASTRSPASFSSSSFGPYNGDLGSAMRPVRVDSRIPNGAISFMKESILVGLADLQELLANVSVSVPSRRYAAIVGGENTYTSTMQLFVLMSSTFPPN